MHQVFISYVEEDGHVAREIAEALEARSYGVWFYERNSIPGPAYLLQTGEAISQAQVVILIISANSLGSSQVDKEVTWAHEAGKPFIPILSGLSHAEFQARRPEWRMALGASTSIQVPVAGVASILPRIVAGVNQLMAGHRAQDHVELPIAVPSTRIASGLLPDKTLLGIAAALLTVAVLIGAIVSNRSRNNVTPAVDVSAKAQTPQVATTAGHADISPNNNVSAMREAIALMEDKKKLVTSLCSSMVATTDALTKQTLPALERFPWCVLSRSGVKENIVELRRRIAVLDDYLKELDKQEKELKSLSNSLGVLGHAAEEPMFNIINTRNFILLRKESIASQMKAREDELAQREKGEEKAIESATVKFGGGR